VEYFSPLRERKLTEESEVTRGNNKRLLKVLFVMNIFLDGAVLLSEERNQHGEYFDDFLSLGERRGFFLKLVLKV
jgi:hypothetical protein